MTKLLHIAPWIATTGGVEALLEEHARKDAAAGFSVRQLSLFDRPARPVAPDGRYLRFSWKSTPHGMRRVMARACAGQPGSVAIYHGAWGVPWFADIDASCRRILFLHDSINRYSAMMPALAGLADGVGCSSESTAREVRRLWPELDPGRVVAPTYPIVPPREAAPERLPRTEWVVGHAGRLTRGHKAAHRLVPFVHEARRLGLKFRLEIMSDGPLRPTLERAFRSDPQIRFLGWQSKADYWRQIQSWDSMVFFSDHEGGPITLLEGMACGALPIYPQIGGSLGDDYVPQVDPVCYYAAGDVAAAARALQSLQARPAGQIAELRRRAGAAVRAHVNADYAGMFAAFVQRVAALPRISRAPDGGRPGRLSDLLPLGLITRVLPGALLH